MESIWEQNEGLTALSLWRDWDYGISSLTTLRIYMFEHHTIPTWNFLLCGGKPELANPNSWAFAWPSILAYAMPPIYAICSLWILMTLVGTLSFYKLFKNWFGNSYAAAISSMAYAFNGYFLSHFNQGHYTWAYFHLIPLMMLLTEQFNKKYLENKPIIKTWIILLLVSWMFFTAGVPHPLFHFYPGFILFNIFLFARAWTHINLRSAYNSMFRLCMAQIFAFSMALYKLWPMAAWQNQFPRVGVVSEKYSIQSVLSFFVRSVQDYDDMNQKYFSDQIWGYWEYNANIGIVPNIIGICVIFKYFLRDIKRKHENQIYVNFSLILILLGVVLSLGNASTLSPSYLFKFFPILRGIRVFPRFEILSLVGIFILNAYGISQFFSWMKLSLRSKSKRLKITLIKFSLSVVIFAPLVASNAPLIWNIRGESYKSIEQKYKFQDRFKTPELITAIPGTQTFLLEHNLWVANCYEPMNVHRPSIASESIFVRAPISTPAPVELVTLSHNEIKIKLPNPQPDQITFNLTPPPNFFSNADQVDFKSDKIVLTVKNLKGNELTFSSLQINDVIGELVSEITFGILVVYLGICYIRRKSKKVLTPHQFNTTH